MFSSNHKGRFSPLVNTSIHFISEMIESALWHVWLAVNCSEPVWLVTDVPNDTHRLLLPMPRSEEHLVPYESPPNFHTQWKGK